MISPTKNSTRQCAIRHFSFSDQLVVSQGLRRRWTLSVVLDWPGLLANLFPERMMNGHSGPWLSPDQSLVALLHHSSEHSVQCSVIRLTDKRKWKIISPDVKSSEAFFYISSVTWATSNTLSLTWMDRSQTTIFYTLCVPPSEASNSYKCNIVSGSHYLKTL